MDLQKTHFTILAIIFFSFLSVSCQENFEKIPETNFDQASIEWVSEFVISYFELVKIGNQYDFKDLATKEFKDSMSPDLQKKSYQQVKEQYGEFASSKYSGTWKKKNDDQYQIIRFKGYFGENKNLLEIRVVLNTSNKIAGFWIKPWKDNLNDS